MQAASPPPKASSPHASGNNMEKINGDMYIADGDYIKDIEVNDLRNRYTLTKGSTQKMVNTLVIPTDTLRRSIRSLQGTSVTKYRAPLPSVILWERI
jgi:hypothetical protein